MIRTANIAGPLLTFAAAFATAPLAAREPVVVTAQPAPTVYQQQVNFADLNLRETHARMVLDRRVMSAAWSVCIAAEGLERATFALGDAGNNCPNSTYHAARPQIRAAIDRAKSGQPAMATNMVISAPRVR
jgi:UrcA family protein